MNACEGKGRIGEEVDMAVVGWGGGKLGVEVARGPMTEGQGVGLSPMGLPKQEDRGFGAVGVRDPWAVSPALGQLHG